MKTVFILLYVTQAIKLYILFLILTNLQKLNYQNSNPTTQINHLFIVDPPTTVPQKKTLSLAWGSNPQHTNPRPRRCLASQKLRSSANLKSLEQSDCLYCAVLQLQPPTFTSPQEINIFCFYFNLDTQDTPITKAFKYEKFHLIQ